MPSEAVRIFKGQKALKFGLLVEGNSLLQSGMPDGSIAFVASNMTWSKGEVIASYTAETGLVARIASTTARRRPAQHPAAPSADQTLPVEIGPVVWIAGHPPAQPDLA